MFQINPIEVKKQRKLVVIWSIAFLIIFPLLITLGYLMRLNQGEQIDIGPNNFYAYMSLHGLGMIGIVYSIAFAAIWYIIGSRYAKLNIKIGYFVFFTVIIGMLMLSYAAVIGLWAPGWYVLYPLPFVGRSWPEWSNTLAFSSLLLMGVGWLLGVIHVLAALTKEFGGFGNILGWQYFKKKKMERELPAVVMISAIALIPALFAFLAAAVFLVMYLMQIFEPSLNFDALLLKNIIMYFGHALANVSLYLCIGWVYCLLPEFTKREWKVDKLLVFAWNLTFFAIVFAFPHHLYMDFAQPRGMHFLGQTISYISIIPATAVSMFGVASQIHRSKVKWGIVPMAFLLGTMGWAIGIMAAVIDATISFNKVLHNTLWVPAHFHTYLVGGVILFIIGFLFYLTHSQEEQYRNKSAKFGFWLYIAGVYVFLAMFYTGGMNSIPRRYSDYKALFEPVHSHGAFLATVAAVGISILLVGLLIMYISIIKGMINRKGAEVTERKFE